MTYGTGSSALYDGGASVSSVTVGFCWSFNPGVRGRSNGNCLFVVVGISVVGTSCCGTTPCSEPGPSVAVVGG